VGAPYALALPSKNEALLRMRELSVKVCCGKFGVILRSCNLGQAYDGILANGIGFA
jgi:hypothetical protein